MSDFDTLEELKQVAKTMTKQEFLDKYLKSDREYHSLNKIECPDNIGLNNLKIEGCCPRTTSNNLDCKLCWEKALDEIEFKNESEDIKNNNKKEFKLTEEFINNGAIHCNTQEEYDNMKQWFKNNDIKIDFEGEYEEWDNECLYILICKGKHLYVSYYKYNDKSCDYNIIEWTDCMPQDVKVKEDIKIEDENEEREITFEDIDINNEGYELNCGESFLKKYIKENKSDLLDITSENISYSDLPCLIKWLQDVYTYGQQVLEEEIEYVDFQTALEWMKQGGIAKLNDYIYYIEDDKFFINDNEHISSSSITYKDIISKEWILIK